MIPRTVENVDADGEPCVLEAVPQPFSFWKEVVPCVETAAPPSAAATSSAAIEPEVEVCFEYHAGYMNRLKPRTDYFVRTSFDEYEASDALVIRHFKYEDGVAPVTIPLNGARRKYQIAIWGAGGGYAPGWYMKQPDQLENAAARMIHGCERSQMPFTRPDGSSNPSGKPANAFYFGGSRIHTDCARNPLPTCAASGSGESKSYNAHTIRHCHYAVTEDYACKTFLIFDKTCQRDVLTQYGGVVWCSPVDEVFSHFQDDASCTDIDECAENPAICGDDTDCFNTVGSFTCGRGSNAGYLKTTLVLEGYSDLVMCPGKAGGSVDPALGRNGNYNDGGTGGRNMCDEMTAVTSFPSGGRGAEDACPWSLTSDQAEWPWEPHACGGGGGGGGSGILALNSNTGQWEWVLIVGGGSGANYRGKGGTAGYEGAGVGTVSAAAGLPGANHGGGGGGGAGSAAAAGDNPAGEAELRARSGETLYDTTHAISVETHAPSNKSPVTAGEVPEEVIANFIGIGGHMASNAEAGPEAHQANNHIGAGDGLIDIEEMPSQDTFKEVWVRFTTTCSCIVEAAAPQGQDPHDGKPSLVRATQTLTTMGLTFVDHSGCEDAYQFFRNGTRFGREFNERAECFETVDATGAGDPLDLTDDTGSLIIGVGEEVEYCARAVGPPVGTDPKAAYYSGKECITVQVKWAGAIGGTVMTRSSSIGVTGVLMTAYILTASEVNNTEVQTWLFEDPNPEEFVLNDDVNESFANITTTRRRRELTRYCPAIDAEDINGLAVYQQFDRTRSGAVATVQCPDIGGTGGASRSLTRSCSPSGNWDDVAGACLDPLLQFTAPVRKFIVANNRPITSTRNSLANTDAKACAWLCLTVYQDCLSFEIFRIGKQPRCYLSRLSTSDNVTLVTPKFDNMEFYELITLSARDVINVTEIGAVAEDIAASYTSSTTCTTDHMAAQYGWPVDDTLGAYMAEQQHLNELAAERCTKVDGNLVVRCEESCGYAYRFAFGMLGGEVRPHQHYGTLCTAPADAHSDFCKGMQIVCSGASILDPSDLTAFVGSVQQLCPDGIDRPTWCARSPVTDLEVQLATDASSIEFRVHDLSALREIESVSGRVEVSRCPQLARFDGGLGKLWEVLGYANGGDKRPISIENNAILGGGLSLIMPSLPAGSVELMGVHDNPMLCVDSADGRVRGTGNAEQSLCGCPFSGASNYNANATFHDGSCDLVQCAACAPGTSGRCFYDATESGSDEDDTTKVCVAMALDGTCPVLADGTQTELCDLCGDVVCDTPPNCRDASSGTCLGRTGQCVYATLLAENSLCDDGNLFTGPDTCSATGDCETVSECNVGTILDVTSADSTYGTAVTTQAMLDSLAGCGTISGHLNIDCSNSVLDPIVSTAALASIASIQGVLRVYACPQLDTLHLTLLRSIRGGIGGSALLLEENAALTPNLNALFPALTDVEGGVYVIGNTMLCANDFDWFEAATIEFNAESDQCGCPDDSAFNYAGDSSLIDDGSCVHTACTEVCVDSNPLDCLVAQCNEATGDCQYAEVVFNASDPIPCDDGIWYHINDTCQVLGDSMDCIGTDLCSADYREAHCEEFSARPGDEQCSYLDSCHKGVCTWAVEPNGLACSLDRLTQTVDLCMDGYCVQNGTDRCFQSRKYDPNSNLVRVLQMFNDTVCESDSFSFANGDLMTFEVFHPTLNIINESHKLSLRVKGIHVLLNDPAAPLAWTASPSLSPTLPPTALPTTDGALPWEVPYPSPAADVDPRHYQSTRDVVGHWEIELLPSFGQMRRNCRMACLEHQLLAVRLRGKHSGDPAHSSFINMCGGGTGCQGPMVSNADCTSNEIDATVCDRWHTQFDACNVPSDTGQRIHAAHYSLDGTTLLWSALLATGYEADAPLAEFATHDSDERTNLAEVEIFNFDVRPHAHVQSTATDATGVYSMTMIAPVPDNERRQTISVSAFAVSDGFQHTLVHITDMHSEIHHSVLAVSHLGQGVANFLDNSTHTITGNVILSDVIGGRGGVTAAQASSIKLDPSNDSCPVQNVIVCALNPATREKIGDCYETEADGYYKLEVMEGDTAIVTAAKTGHTFATQPSDLVGDTPGDVAGVERIMTGRVIDIVDVSIMHVELRYGAGLCREYLGGAAFGIQSLSGNPACNVQSPVMTEDTDTRVPLPLQAYNITLLDVSTAADLDANGFLHDLSDQGILDYIGGDDPQLFNSEGSTSLSREVADRGADASYNASWILHRAPQVAVSCLNCAKPHCFDGPLVASNLADLANGEIQAFATMSMGSIYTIVVSLREVFYARPNGDETFCSHVPGTVLLTESVSEGQSEKVPIVFNRTVDPTTDLPIGSGSVQYKIAAGPPNTMVPFARVMRFAFADFVDGYGGQGWNLVKYGQDTGRTKVRVIVEGQARAGADTAGGMRALKIPEYMPMLIIRNPPGDMSFAEMTTEHSSSAAFSMAAQDPSFSFPGSASLTPVIKTKSDICAGLGVSQCVAALEFDSDELFKLSFAIHTESKTTHHKAITVNVNFQSSIRTTTIESLAGAAGDLYLSVGLSIRFETVNVVNVNEACIGALTQTERWHFDQASAGGVTMDEQTALNKVARAPIVADSKVPSSKEFAQLIEEVEPAQLFAVVQDLLLTQYMKEPTDAQWNTHMFQNLYDIIYVRIPQLERTLLASKAAVECIEAYNEVSCPSFGLVSNADLYGTPELHRMRMKVAQAGIDGWHNTVLAGRQIATQAETSEAFAMNKHEIWSTPLTGSKRDFSMTGDHDITLARGAEEMAAAILQLEENRDYNNGVADAPHMFNDAKESALHIDEVAGWVLMAVDIGSGLVAGLLEGAIKKAAAKATKKAAAQAESIAKEAAEKTAKELAEQNVKQGGRHAVHMADTGVHAPIAKSTTKVLELARLIDDVGLDAAMAQTNFEGVLNLYKVAQKTTESLGGGAQTALKRSQAGRLSKAIAEQATLRAKQLHQISKNKAKYGGAWGGRAAETGVQVEGLLDNNLLMDDLMGVYAKVMEDTSRFTTLGQEVPFEIVCVGQFIALTESAWRALDSRKCKRRCPHITRIPHPLYFVIVAVRSTPFMLGTPWRFTTASARSRPVLLTRSRISVSAVFSTIDKADNVITFSGGSEYEFHFEQSTEREEEFGETIEIEIDGSIENEVEVAAFGFGVEFESGSGVQYEFNAEKSHANAQSQGTTMSFVLADNDAGDEFE